MAKQRKAKNTRKKPARETYIKTQFRFADQAHKDLIDRAVEFSGLPSMNAWLIQATTKQARKELEG
jgi:hypothetical protein